MRKFNILCGTIALAIIGMLFAGCSFGGPISKIEKIRGAYGSLMLDYNIYGDNYQAMIPLQDLIPDFEKPEHTKSVTVTFDYYALSQLKSIQVLLVSNSNNEAVGTWTSLTSGNYINGTAGLDIGDTGTYSHTFPIETASTNTDLRYYYLVVNANLRDGESSTHHEDRLEFFATPQARMDTIYLELVEDKIIIETDPDYGFKITLKGSDDNYWTENRYQSIEVLDHVNISIGGDNQRPNGAGDTKVVYFPFVNQDSCYTFRYWNGEEHKGTLWTDAEQKYGELNLASIKNIQLTRPVEPYPIAKLDNIDQTVLDSPLNGHSHENDYRTSYKVTLYGGEGWDAWLGERTKTSQNYTNFENVAFSLLKFNGTENTEQLTRINEKGAWWYSFSYVIEDKNNSNCTWVYNKDSDKTRLNGVTLTPENEYFSTHAADKYPDVYVQSSTTGVVIPVSDGGQYTIEWVTSANFQDENEWNDFVVPENWTSEWALSGTSGDKLYIDYSPDNSNGSYSNEDSITTTKEFVYTASVDGYIKIYSDYGVGYFHVYKSN